MGNLGLQSRLSSRGRFFSKSLIWEQKPATRDPEAKVRAVAPGSRLPVFSYQIKDLEKKWCRDDKVCLNQQMLLISDKWCYLNSTTLLFK